MRGLIGHALRCAVVIAVVLTALFGYTAPRDHVDEAAMDDNCITTP